MRRDDRIFKGERAAEISERGAIFSGGKVIDIKTSRKYFPKDSIYFLSGFEIKSCSSNMIFYDSHLLDFAGNKNYKLGLNTRLCSFGDSDNDCLCYSMSFNALGGNYHMWRNGHLIDSFREFGRLDKSFQNCSKKEADVLQKLMLRNHRVVVSAVEDLFFNNQVLPQDFLNKYFQSGDVLF
jgi:hypothetical protein